MVLIMPGYEPNPADKYAQQFVSSLRDYLGEKEQGEKNVQMGVSSGLSEEQSEQLRFLSPEDRNLVLSRYLRADGLQREQELQEQERQRQLEQQIESGKGISSFLGLSPERSQAIQQIPIGQQLQAINLAEQQERSRVQQEASQLEQIRKSEQERLKMDKPTENFYDNLIKKAADAEQVLNTTTQLEALLDKGALNIDWKKPSSYLSYLANQVGITQFDPGDKAQFRTLATELVKNFKGLFGNMTDREFKAIQDAIPNVLQRPEAARSIIESYKKGAQLTIEKRNAFDELLTSGLTPLQARTQLNKEFVPRERQIIENTIDSWGDKSPSEEGSLEQAQDTSQRRRVVRKEGWIPMIHPETNQVVNVPQDQYERAKSLNFTDY